MQGPGPPLHRTHHPAHDCIRNFRHNYRWCRDSIVAVQQGARFTISKEALIFQGADGSILARVGVKNGGAAQLNVAGVGRTWVAVVAGNGSPGKTNPTAADISLCACIAIITGVIGVGKGAATRRVTIVCCAGFPSTQERFAVGRQAVPTQLSPRVHASPSSQEPVTISYTQPETESHASAVQGLSSWHITGVPPEHMPAEQFSPSVHASPSSHGDIRFV